MVTVFLAEGFEETEVILPVDILRRGGVEVRLCSITSSRTVTGAHGVVLTADALLDSLFEEEDVILLPGGMPGTLHLKECKALGDRILAHDAKGKLLCAICAAPTVFGALGILKNAQATCYPGMERELFCKEAKEEPVVLSGNIITSRGPGTAALFGTCILEVLKGKEVAEKVVSAMLF